MSIKERMESLKGAANNSEVQPTDGLRKTLLKSGIEGVVDDFGHNFANSKVTKEVQEEGKRMYLEILWPFDQQGEVNRIVVSVREDVIKFIGRSYPQQFLELKGEDLCSKELMEDSIVQTHLHPSVVKKG